jgi:hypothetical protein
MTKKASHPLQVIKTLVTKFQNGSLGRNGQRANWTILGKCIHTVLEKSGKFDFEKSIFEGHHKHGEAKSLEWEISAPNNDFYV